ncbi:hypothetical protein MF672_005980 [Actinomadura sp. ATCC 31491]|uniref:Uncharacterized protein n=1 Tax=Actinomadura luzonensis TaxID=2805427 RepID=A0ABT0FN76_9ACTN|nr:hypothetical protein [Actinomadura luzonensis]MCK2213343.1 hypothetical protein [Actinomadura luzonensis]
MASSVEERQYAYAQRALIALGDELKNRDVPVAFVVAEDGRPCLEVADVNSRVRRVFVHAGFCWFYWGDQGDERVTCLRLAAAVERIAQAAQDGWHDGEQGELCFNLHQIAEAYRL